jgi:hypothetical protein
MHQQKLQLGCTEIFRIFGLARKIALYAGGAQRVDASAACSNNFYGHPKS